MSKQVSTVKNDSVGGGGDGDCSDDALSMVNDRIAHAADGNDAEDVEEELEALRAIFGDVRVTAPDLHGEQTWWVPLGEGRVFSVTIPDGCVDSHASVGNTKNFSPPCSTCAAASPLRVAPVQQHLPSV
jgi:hypothetical protein